MQIEGLKSCIGLVSPLQSFGMVDIDSKGFIDCHDLAVVSRCHGSQQTDYSAAVITVAGGIPERGGQKTIEFDQ